MGLRNGSISTLFALVILTGLPAAFAGPTAVKDDVSEKNIVQIAVDSKDHTTLVTAVKAAGLVESLEGAGPYTVFAPTNAAFAKLPKGTVEGLLKPDKKEALADILEYHTFVGVLKTDLLKDGATFGQANGQNIKVSVKNGKITINDTATIIGTVKGSNGVIHVIDSVLLPPKK